MVEKSTLLGIEGEDQGINCSSRELVLPYPTKMDVKRISSLLFSNFWCQLFALGVLILLLYCNSSELSFIQFQAVDANHLKKFNSFQSSPLDEIFYLWRFTPHSLLPWASIESAEIMEIYNSFFSGI